MTPEETRRLEAIADRAWPAAEVVPYDGWDLRSTGPGIGRRLNSAATFGAGTLPLTEKIAFVEAFYRERALPPIFKLTAASQPPGLEEALVAAFYHSEGEVSVQVRDLPARPAVVRADVGPRISPGWQMVNEAAGGHYGAAPAVFADLVHRIEGQVGFATIEVGGQPAAAGLGVVDDGMLGIFEIGTHPDHRRQGLARRVVLSLLAWGAEEEARSAYLQVMTVNGPARALYDGLGFTEAYRYWYRVAPAPGP